MSEITIDPAIIDAVERLLVYHLGDSITTPVAVTPEQLERLAITQRYDTTNPRDFRAAFDALLSGDPIPDPDSSIDTRWGVLFIGRDGEPLIAVYTDRFGLQGMLGGYFVLFQHPTFLRWLEGRFTA